MVHYITGVIGTFVVCGTAVAATLTSVQMIGGRSVRLTTVLDAALQLGLLGTAGIAIIVGPIILLMLHVSKQGLSVMGAALAGASLAPVLLFALWLMIRESTETFAMLLQFWSRVPGELFVGLVPHAAGAAFLAAWLAAGHRRVRDRPLGRI